MFEAAALESAVSSARPFFSEIQGLYKHLPETRCECDRPGVCCVFLPEMTLMEAMQWMDVLLNMKRSLRRERVLKFVEFYLVTPLREMGCPFLENGQCTIYPVRPFACRAYGVWSRERGERRTRNSRKDRKALLNMWKRFGIVIPEAWVPREIDYCRQVICTSTGFSDADLMQVLQTLYRLDDHLPQLKARFEKEVHSDFSFLTAAVVLGYQKAVLGKYAVIKEIVQERKEDRLNAFLQSAVF